MATQQCWGIYRERRSYTLPQSHHIRVLISSHKNFIKLILQVENLFQNDSKNLIPAALSSAEFW